MFTLLAKTKLFRLFNINCKKTLKMTDKISEAKESQNINSVKDLLSLSEEDFNAVSLFLYLFLVLPLDIYVKFIWWNSNILFLKQKMLPTNEQTTKFGSTNNLGPTAANNSQPQRESNVEKARRESHAVVERRFNPQPKKPLINIGDLTQSYLKATVASQQVSLLIN